MGEDAIPGGDQDSAQHARRRLTVAQAAEAMDVTVDAIRARIKRETIEHVREGGRVYVILGTDQGATKRVQDHAQYIDQGSAQPGPDYHDELVEELRDRVRSLEEANRENRRIIAGLIQRVPELEPPPGTPSPEPHGPETVTEEPEGTEAPTGRGERETGVQRRRAERSWWRRFFGFEDRGAG